MENCLMPLFDEDATEFVERDGDWENFVEYE